MNSALRLSQFSGTLGVSKHSQIPKKAERQLGWGGLWNTYPQCTMRWQCAWPHQHREVHAVSTLQCSSGAGRAADRSHPSAMCRDIARCSPPAASTGTAAGRVGNVTDLEWQHSDALHAGMMPAWAGEGGEENGVWAPGINQSPGGISLWDAALSDQAVSTLQRNIRNFCIFSSFSFGRGFP